MRSSVDVEKAEGEGYAMGPIGGMDSFLDKVTSQSWDQREQIVG